jgi:hypothetical protein
MRRSVAITLAAGVALIGVAIVVVLARSQPTVAATNSVSATNYIELEERGRLSECQPAAAIPQGTSAVRIGVEGLYFSPAASVTLLAGSHFIARGHHVPGGPAAPNVTVPIGRLSHAVRGARVCIAIGPALEPIRFYGAPRHLSTQATNPLQEAILHLDYLRAGSRSWWSRVSSIAYHMGLGHAPGGAGVVFLLILLMLAVIAATCRLALQELR